ncbi:hypothetical protein SAMN05444336_109100 [Albimonas donghaensis]|uniref:Uncharacterized protein n=2 Tax=Albimonas donghaensis TaxID=356660 RepID=A0A1H3E7F3_9RHOB|nr:hypothetical protein SAMN05444336_109100 [Albimonas donghaensis]
MINWWEDKRTCALMREYVFRNQLVGPTDADIISDPEARRILFDFHDRLYKQKDSSPSYVVGRRGSGKTAYLSYIEGFGKYDICINIDKWKVFKEVGEISSQGGGTVFVEEMDDYWDSVLFTIILSELRRRYPRLISRDQFLENYFGELGVERANSATSFLTRLIRRLNGRYASGSSGGMLSALFGELFNEFDEPGRELRQRVESLCRDNEIRVVILIDSLESYKVDDERVSDGIKGFLKSVGKFNTRRNRPEVRCCIPSELYYNFLALSTNAGKDFNPPLFLHWKSSEILSVVAHRMCIHMRLYNDGSSVRNRELLGLNLDSRQGLQRFFEKVFPEMVTNETGDLERPEIFILRHTQMLPRQALKIFHSVIRENYSETGEYAYIQPRHVLDGTYKIVNELATSVCTAFRASYPGAWKVCRDVVPRLGYTFKLDELEVIYRRHLRGRPGISEKVTELDFARMLIELGCIGVQQNVSDRYQVAQFEYNSRGELMPRGTDTLCVHPMFRGPNGDRKSDEALKSVYPVGVDPYEDFS